MASSSVCWGIEIGAAAIKAVKLEALGDGNVRVLDFAVIPHPKVLSTPEVDANDVLRVSLGALASQYDLSKAAIAVSVPGHSAFARFAKLPPVEPKKVPDIVKFEAMQQIPFPLENVEWDYQTFVSPDSPDVEVGIFAITREKVNERLNMLADVGIYPNYVVLSPIAVYNALAYDLSFDNKTPGTIIVDVGTTSTDLVIATPGRMWVRTFHIGGHQFTEALVNQFQLSYPKAEKLKKEAEDTKHARQVFQAMRPVFTDLAQEIQRSIGYYQSINKDAQLVRLIGVGSTFLLPGLRKYLKQQLGMDVYRVDAQTPFKRATIEGERAAAFAENTTTLVTAYGLALQGLGLNAVGGNLMPTAVLRKAMWKEKVGWFGLAAGIAGLASAVMFIRPVRNHFEATGRITDPIVASTLNNGSQLRSTAVDAKVTDAGEPDMRAANMVSLLERRAMFEMITADLQSLFAFSDSKVPGWERETAQPPVPGPAYSLVSFNTRYYPPNVVAADAMDLDPGAQPETDADSNTIQSDDSFPRIRCELVVNTSQPLVRRFIDRTLEVWFAEAQNRTDLPYTVTKPTIKFTEVKSEGAAPEAGREAGRGAPQAPEGSREGGRAARRSAPRIEYGQETGGRGGASGSSGPSPDQTQLNTLAPIEQPPTTGPATTGVVTVDWYIVFKPKPAPAADETGGF